LHSEKEDAVVSTFFKQIAHLLM